MTQPVREPAAHAPALPTPRSPVLEAAGQDVARPVLEPSAHDIARPARRPAPSSRAGWLLGSTAAAGGAWVVGWVAGVSWAWRQMPTSPGADVAIAMARMLWPGRRR